MHNCADWRDGIVVTYSTTKMFDLSVFVGIVFSFALHLFTILMTARVRPDPIPQAQGRNQHIFCEHAGLFFDTLSGLK